MMAKTATQNKTVKKIVTKKESADKSVNKVTPTKKVIKKSAAPVKVNKATVAKKASPTKVSTKKAATKVVKKVAAPAKSKAVETEAKIVEIKKPVVKKSKPTKVSLDIVDVITKAMVDKKALKVVCIDLRKIESASTDYFIICHGTSTTHVDAIASNVEDEVQKQLAEKPFHTEGYQNAEWILIDYFNVVVHVFLEEKRDFYRLEKLWADGEITTVN